MNNQELQVKTKKLSVSMKTHIIALLAAVLLGLMLIYMIISLQAYRGIFQTEVASFDEVEMVEDARINWSNLRSQDIMLLTQLQSGKIDNLSGSGDAINEVNELLGKVNDRLSEMEKASFSSEQKALLADMHGAVENYTAAWGEFTGNASGNKAKALQAAHVFAQFQEENGFTFADKSRALLDTYEAESEASARAQATTESTTVVVSIIILAIGAALVFMLVRMLVAPMIKSVHALSAGMEKLTQGDFTAEVQRYSSDEVGDMGDHFNDAMSGLRQSLTVTIGTAENVGKITEGIGEGSRGAVAATQKATDYINSGAAAAEQVSRSIQTVAAGAEEMSVSIKEISSNANAAAGVAKEASEVAQQTNETVAKLGESSREVGEVIETITAVAEQTNLLALNATIEAARAGDAGRGFAVVASEVKDLAAETGRATEEVAVKVEQIQTDTQAAVAAIEEISNIIASINDYQTTIAAAVEEQTATTNEMSRSVSEAADGSTTIAENVADIARNTNNLAERFADVDQKMGVLATESHDLVTRLNEFKY
ncbi:methyl-accepting chemotaxis protein [Mobiluncus curtisii]|uniref:Methyl-accepting chemotaxis protein signaling domain protein n=1 Tax=Mobiluncus curtisii (strain ATCC 43063 / DSM 2711 / V125) TaxID=548479 RepID=D6ZFU7_MOBCV|nr:methyl-accepting chemotaxis protein signaling domain protein [Mobiluncus curtisii ATCC 43063]QQU08779.1 methyl-accepting chemotaxis protein [Mobiluncus curtisii]